MAHKVKREKQNRSRRRAKGFEPFSLGRTLVSALLVVTLSAMSFSPAIAVPADTSSSSSAVETQASSDSAENAATVSAAGETDASSDGAQTELAQSDESQSSDQSSASQSASTDEADASDAASSSSSASASSDASSSSSSSASSSSSSASSSSSESASAESTTAEQTEKTIEYTLKSTTGSYYTVKVKYDTSAAIPDGTQIKIVESVLEPSEPNWQSNPAYKDRPYETEQFVSAGYLAERSSVVVKNLGLPEESYVFSSKFLNISLVSDGKQVTPKSAVKVTIETNSVDVSCSDAIELAEMVYDEAVAKDAQAVKDGYVAGDGKTARALSMANATYDVDAKTNRSAASNGVVKLEYSTDKFGELAMVGVAVPKITIWQDDASMAEVLGAASQGLDAYEIDAANLPEDKELLAAYAFGTSDQRERGTMLWARVVAPDGKSAVQASAGSFVGYQVKGGAIASEAKALGAADAVLSFKADEGVAFAQNVVADSAKENSSDSSAAATEAAGSAVTLSQAVTTFDGKSYSVSVSCDANAGVPADATLSVRELSGSDYELYHELTAQVLDAESFDYLRAFDITILDAAGNEVEPKTPVSVTINLVGSADLSNASVVHYGKGSPDIIRPAVSSTIVSDTLDFTAESFSVYVIVNHEDDTDIVTPRVEFHFIDDEYTENQVDNVYTYTAGPYNFTNKSSGLGYQTTQIVTNGETVEYIKNPSNKSDDEYFYGWYVVNASGDTTAYNSETGKYTGEITYTLEDDPVHVPYGAAIGISYDSDANTVTWTLNDTSYVSDADDYGCAHVYLAPNYQDYYFVNFRVGAKEESTLSQSLMTRKLVVLGEDESSLVRIGNVQAPSTDSTHLVFSGWETVTSSGETAQSFNTTDENGAEIDKTAVLSTGAESDNEEGTTGYYIKVEIEDFDEESDSAVDLYPVFDEARWIYYNTGKSGNGATYVGAQYRLTNDDGRGNYYDASNFASKIPTRNGYTFDGWYVDAVVDGDGNITNLTDPADVTYTDSDGNQVTQSVTATKLINSDGSLALTDYEKAITVNGADETLYKIIDSKLYLYKALDSLTLYANWEPIEDAEYTVIVWKESMTDTYVSNYDADKKNFDFVQSYSFVGTSNETITSVSRSTSSSVTDVEGTYYDAVITGTKADGTTVNETLSYTGYYCGDYDTNVTIDPEGTSVVNVYYYRNVVTYTFYTYGNSYSGYERTTSDSNDPQQYGVVNGEYVALTRSEGTDVTVWTPEYTYTATTEDGDYLYGLVDGEYVALTAVYGETTEEVDAYLLASEVTSGKNYLIVSANSVGTANALGYTTNGNNASVASDEVTVNSGSPVYVRASDVDSTSVWAASSGWRFKNGNYYVSRGNGSNLTINTNGKDWSWDSSYNRLSTQGSRNTYYLYYSNSGFAVNTNPNSVYLYEKGTVTEQTTRIIGYTYNGGTAYTGNRYTRADGGSEYTGTRYVLESGGYTVVTSEDGTQYGVDGNGGHVKLVKGFQTVYTWMVPEYSYVYTASDNGTYGKVGDDYVELTRTYRRTGYTYTQTTGNSGTQYGVVDGEFVQLSYYDYWGTRYYYYDYSYWDGYSYYNGNRYTRSNSSSDSYTGTVYSLISGTAGSGESGFEETSAVSGDGLYGRDGSTYFQLSAAEGDITYSYNGETYTGTRYTRSYEPTGEYVEYTGLRYIVSSGSGWHIYRDEIGLYGETLNWPSDSSLWWYEGYSGDEGSGTRMTYKAAFLPLDDDMTVEYYGTVKSGSGTINFYTQDVDDTSSYTLAQSITSGNGNFSINDKFSGFSAYQYRTDNGSWKNVGTYNSSTGIYGSAVSYDSSLDIRYNRNSNDLIYFANYPTGKNLTFDGVSEYDSNVVKSADQLNVSSILYGASLSDYSSYYDIADNNPTGETLIAPDHYVFGGWYKDDACTKKFDFDATMPDGNAVAYAKWTPERFRVYVNPNGGEIDHIDHTGASYEGTYNGISYDVEPFRADSSLGYNKSQATYINASYGAVISEYEVENDYVPVNDVDAARMDSDDVYYYVNTQYQSTDSTGLPSALRNALYMTEDEIDDYYRFYSEWLEVNLTLDPGSFTDDSGYTTELLQQETWEQLYVSEQKYRKVQGSENNEFLGWYQVGSDGTLSSMPYNFQTPVSGEVKLQAMWRLDGGYTIQYTPEYITDDGDEINGDMEMWSDPSTSGATYADGAETNVYKQPTGITCNGSATDEYVFLGWRVVSVGGTTDNPTYTPLEYETDSDGNTSVKYYDPGDDFTVKAELAQEYTYVDDSNVTQSMMVIHMQAVYEAKDSSYRRPEVANLTLDANASYAADGTQQYEGYLTDGTVDSTTGAKKELTSDTNVSWSETGTAGTVIADDSIEFGDIQSNEAVQLFRYATTDTHTVDNSDVTGTNYFAHPENYRLLGFDEAANEGDFVATYAADSVVAAQRTDNETLYAVWEPLVYLNLVNQTSYTSEDGTEHAGGDLTVSLDSSSSSALYVVNQANGDYERVAIDGGSVTIPVGETVRLAIPYGSEQDVTISGKNSLGTGYVLYSNSYLNYGEEGQTKRETGTREDDTTSPGTPNTKRFTISDTLITDAEGIDVVFTAVKNPHTLVLDDNYSEGGTQEIAFPDDLSGVSYELPGTSTRWGYELLGWAHSDSATTADYPMAGVHAIDDMSGFFTTYDTDADDIVTLYGVWEDNSKASVVNIKKEVTEPGDTTKEFAFSISLSGSYSYGNNGTGTISEMTSTAFSLKDGEYLKITTQKDTGGTKDGTNVAAYLKMTIQKYDANDEAAGDPVTLEWNGASLTDYSGKYRSVSFTETNMSVAEGDYSSDYYDTTLAINNVYTNSDFNLNDEKRMITWDNTDAGGYITVTNERQTADVVVSKAVVDPVNSDPSFSFSVDVTGDVDEYVLDQNAFTLQRGATYTIEDVPVGATVTIAETADYDYTTTAALTNTSTGDAVADGDASDCGVSFTLPAEGVTVAYANTLKSCPVVIRKVDQDGNVGVQSLFDLESTLINHTGINGYSGSVLDDTLYVDTYKLTETWVQDGYEGLDKAVTLTLSGTEDGMSLVSSDTTSGHVVVSGDYASGFVVTIYNLKTVDVTIQKVLSDPLISQRSFSFTYAYKYALNGVDYGVANKTFNMTAVTGNAVSTTIAVPAGATDLVVAEDTSKTIGNTNLTIAGAYQTTVEQSGFSENVSISSPSCTVSEISSSDTAGSITFTNTRIICKITDSDGNTLRIDGEPAVYSSLETAFSDFGSKTFTTESDSSTSVTPSHIKMMVENYDIPCASSLTVPADMSLTLTTAGESDEEYPYSGTSGTYCTINRGSSNTANSLFTVSDDESSFTTTNITFDGGATFTYDDDGVISGVSSGQVSVKGGIVNASSGVLTIGDNTTMQYSATSSTGGAVYSSAETLIMSGAFTFKYCAAYGAGAVYHDQNASGSVTDASSAEGASFEVCVSNSGTDKYGGGAIKSRAEEFLLNEVTFTSCQSPISSEAQGGAFIHYPNPNFTTSTTSVEECSFNSCHAYKAGGAFESDAAIVTVTGSQFKDCSTTDKEGGAICVWSRDSGSSKDTSLTIASSTFDSCSCATSRNNRSIGGAVASFACSTIIKEGTKFLECSSNDSGGAIALCSGNASSTASADDVVIDSCASKVGGAIYNTQSALTLSNMTITDCSATSTGGGVHQNSGSTTMTSGEISGCTATSNGGGFYLNSGSLAIEGGTISGCTATNSGGGVFQNNGTLTLAGGTISGCTAGNGGGAYQKGGTLTLAGGTIRECTATTRGGGVYGEATVVLSGGSITYCTAKCGGGMTYSGWGSVTVCDEAEVSYNTATGEGGGGIEVFHGTLNMEGGAVSNNIAPYPNGDKYYNGRGGGIFSRGNNNNGSSVNITGGTISGNVASRNGGGIFVQNTSTITISGGVIDSNKAGYTNLEATEKSSCSDNTQRPGWGAGIFRQSGNNTITLSGGSITNNVGTLAGAGIYLQANNNDNYPGLKISVSPTFSGNTIVDTSVVNGNATYDPSKQDIFLAGYNGSTVKSIVVNGDLTCSNEIWVWPEYQSHYEEGDQFAIVGSGVTLSDADTTFSKFRNARDDDTTGCSSGAYLIGVSAANSGNSNANSSYVYWGRTVNDTTKVILQKTDGDYNSLAGATFLMYRGSTSGSQVTSTDEQGNTISTFTSGDNGVFFVGDLSYGDYYLHETSPNDRWFKVTVSASGVTCADAA